MIPDVRAVIDVRSWYRRAVRFLAGGRIRGGVWGLTVVALVVCAAAGVWAARYAVVGATLALPPPYELAYGGVSYGSGALHVADVTVRYPAGGLELTAPSVDIRGVGLGALFGSDAPLDVTANSPRLSIAATRSALGALREVADSLTTWRRWRAGLRLSVADGAGEFSDGAAGADSTVTMSGMNGALRVAPDGSVRYDVALSMIDANTAYPVRGSAALERGSVVHRWSADALPLVGVLGLLGAAPDVLARGGTLRGASVTFSNGALGTSSDPQLRGAAHLEAGDVTIGASGHEVRGLHGDLTIVDDGLASRLLAGTIDGAPLEVSGEVHDVHGARFRWLSDGTDDLRAVVNLAEKVAAQDRVRSLRLEPVAPGIALAQYATQKTYGPLVVTVAFVNPKEPTLSFDTVLAHDRITSGGERTSAMGARTGAVLGINGDYYDIGGTWAPQGIVVRSGVLLRTPIERMALTVHRDRRVTFQEYRFWGTVRVARQEAALTQLNSWPAGDVTLMTPEYGTIPPAAEVTLAELTPLRAPGRFRVVRVGSASTPTPSTYALAIGPRVRLTPKVGDLVTVRYGVTPAADDAIAAIGGGPLLLRDGQWFEDPHAPAPDERDVHWAVVAVGRTSDDNVLVFQVDGRHPERSIGMTRPDFAALMQGFGAVDAMALDSGGSSTIVSRAPGDSAATLRNHPSDNDGERWVSNGLFVFSSAAAGPLLASTPAVPAGNRPSAQAP